MDKEELNRLAVTLEISNRFLDEIRAGDSDHGLSVGQMLLSEGPNFDSDLLIVLVESVIELAAHAGSTDAREYLEQNWPTLKTSHLRRLKKNQQT